MAKKTQYQFKYLTLSICLCALLFTISACYVAETSNDLVENNKLSEDKWKQLTILSFDLLKQGKLHDGIKTAEEILSLANKSFEPNHLIIRKSKNHLAKIYIFASNQYFFEGKFDKVILSCNKVININPESPLLAEAFIYKGMAYSWSDLDKALLNFNKAIEINPKSGHYYLGRAGIYIKLACADWKKACSDFNLCDEYNQAKEKNICEGIEKEELNRNDGIGEMGSPMRK